MAEFGRFGPTTQQYIMMVLDCVRERGAWKDYWRPRILPRMLDRAFANMAVQRELRDRLARFWSTGKGDAELMPLILTSSFDFGMAELNEFAPYRFLAERLYGSQVRPLLPAVGAAAALLPHHPAAWRAAFLNTIDQDAIEESLAKVTPTFFPGMSET